MRLTRITLLLGLLLLGVGTQRAAAADVLNHLSLAVTGGTDGIGGEMAMPVTKIFAMRLGYTWMPKIKAKANLHSPSWREECQRVEVEGTASWRQFKALVDIYPWPSHGFHFTAGIYKVLGDDPREVLYVTNTEPVVDSKGNVRTDYGFVLGDYVLYPDESGYFSCRVLTKSLRPYLGLGFGRAIPKRRVNVTFDAGLQLWGTPKVFASDGQGGEVEVHEKEAETVQIKSGSILRKVTKMRVYPSITLRIAGRIF